MALARAGYCSSFSQAGYGGPRSRLRISLVGAHRRLKERGPPEGLDCLPRATKFGSVRAQGVEKPFANVATGTSLRACCPVLRFVVVKNSPLLLVN